MRNEDGKNLGIVGGREAKPGAWPWQAAVYVKSQFRCGGALFKENSVLTVAHCFSYDGKVEPRDVMVVMGKNRTILSVLHWTYRSLTVRLGCASTESI